MKADVEEAVAAEKAERKRRGRPPTTASGDEVVSWFWVIVAFLLIEGTLVQARVIPSGSMEKTVLIGDHLIVSRIGYDAGIPFTQYHVPLWRESEAAADHRVSRAAGRRGLSGFHQARASACRATTSRS